MDINNKNKSNDFKEVLSKYKSIVEEELDDFFKVMPKPDNNYVQSVYNKIHQFVLNGGKRLRPIALIQAYNAIKGNVTDEIVKTSLCVELYHNSTLIHDDIMDEDISRRNKDTVFESIRKEFVSGLKNNDEYDGVLFGKKSARYSTTQAILAGNVLSKFAKDPILQSKYDDEVQSRALTILCHCIEKINVGQIEDTYLEIKENPTEDEYYSMIKGKTGQLFVSSIQIGAVLAGATPEQFQALTNYAWNAATTFQLQDDIIDIQENNKKGHERGSDIMQGKMTLLIIKALELANDEDKEIIKKTLGDGNATKEEIEKVINVIEKTGALDYSKELALDKIKAGKEFLKQANFDKQGVQFFEGFADYMIERDI
jgi:geranylgeranyl diphosphate synthase type I